VSKMANSTLPRWIMTFMLVCFAWAFVVEAAQAQTADKKNAMEQKADDTAAKASDEAIIKADKDARKQLDDAKRVKNVQDASRKIRKIKVR